MYRPFLLIVLTVVLMAVSTCSLDAIADPFATSVTRIEREYFENGQIRHEMSFNRLGELHGPDVYYNGDGQMVFVTVYERGSWTFVREFHYEQGLMRTHMSTWMPPYFQIITESLPDEYRDHCPEQLREHS